MALFVDSAYIADVAAVCASYPITGVTTNPSILLAAVQRGQRLSDLEVLRELLRVCRGPVLMQPTVASGGDDEAAELRAAAERYIAVAPDRVVPKLPPSEAGLRAGRALVQGGCRVAYTAASSLAQAYCAAEAGASWVIPYFARMRRAGEDARERVHQMSRLLAQQQAPTRILIASIKSPADLVEATLAGAHDVTAPPEIIRALLQDVLSDAAFAQFARDAEQLRSTPAAN